MSRKQRNQSKTVIIAVIVAIFTASAALAGPPEYSPFEQEEQKND